VTTDVLYNVIFECGIPMKLFRLIRICLNEAYIKVSIGKNLSDAFPIQNGLKEKGRLIAIAFKIFLQEGSRKGGRIRTECKISAAELC
jgi:hypothetical protein